MRIVTAVGATALLALYPAQAQTLKPALDYVAAAKIRDGCIAWAAERNLHVATAIFNSDGTLITFAKMDGVPAAIVEIAQWKGKSAATFQEASANTANWGGPAPGMSTWGGGVPFFAEDGSPLGGVGTSGSETGDDIACGEAGIAAAGMRAKAK
ncbi:MAG: heme-binding protein [Allopontixanthobacter sediminis]